MESSASSSKRQVHPSAKLGPAQKAAVDSESLKPTSSTSMSSVVPDGGSASNHESDSMGTPRPNWERKCSTIVFFNDDTDTDDNAAASPSKLKKKKKATKKRKVSGNLNCADDNRGATIQSIDINDSDLGTQTLNKSDPTTDLKHFFKKVLHEKGNNKGHVECICCSGLKTLSQMVKQHSTQRHHMQSKHAAKYCKWAKKNNFDSMLPADTKG
ncbi:hypothetical protein CPB84DRAFT_1852095 [Gymnopilus junonius]|uniref:Uncharacterized protein n=1 Tax=Gymnopilus junonius TaxID=109634 RepID=A0A9P5TGX0_GYMJU|nr:hypothetical protein CPB84DRAFT_1852095 [Gymnopilus junonius]